jgi:shikimate kinase
LKTNITLLLPLNHYKKKLASMVAKKLGMFFVDLEELLQFELLDLKKALSVNGKNYIEVQENKLVQRVCSYSNAFITLNTTVFLREKNLKQLKEHTLIVYFELTKPNYLKLLKKEKTGDAFELDKTLFEERNNLLKHHADLIVTCQNANKKDLIKQLLQEIDHFYAKKGN